MIGSGSNAEAVGSEFGMVVGCADAAAIDVNAANITTRRLLMTSPSPALSPGIYSRLQLTN
jgi:hypothetical protein